MNKNILKLLESIGEDEGKIINNLIEGGIFTQDYIVKKAIESNSSSIMYNVGKYITGFNIEELAKGIIKLDNARYIHSVIDVKNASIEELVDAIIASDNKDKKRPTIEGKPEDNGKEIDYLMTLASNGQIEQIRNNKSAWTNLFIDEIEETHGKSRVLKPNEE